MNSKKISQITKILTSVLLVFFIFSTFTNTFFVKKTTPNYSKDKRGQLLHIKHINGTSTVDRIDRSPVQDRIVLLPKIKLSGYLSAFILPVLPIGLFEVNNIFLVKCLFVSNQDISISQCVYRI